jgi:hypothetical protein
LVRLVEEDYDALLARKVGGDEDRDVGFGFLGGEGKADSRETDGGEAVGYDVADGLLRTLVGSWI